jgi:hypothetical protein
MPDWTYLPLRGVAERVVGWQRARRRALGFVSTLAATRAGQRLIRTFDLTEDLPAARCADELPSPCGIVLDRVTSGQRAALRSMGFGWVTTPQDAPAGAVTPDSTDFDTIVLLARSGQHVVLNAAVIEHGPTLAQRVNEVLQSDVHTDVDLSVDWLRPWRWHSWVWAMWLGIAMVCAGIGAAIITYGPVLLGYDKDFLGVDTRGLDAINARLVPFLQHDRVTMAGCMAAIGFNDIGFAMAMRRGWPWARVGFAVAGAIGFPTFFLFLGYKFLDPLHLAVAVGFFPLYLLGVFGKRVAPTWRAPDRVDETARHRAAFAQLMMIAVAVGVFLSGFVIMSIGLRDVLIPSDRVFLSTEQQTMRAALDGRLLRFIAHDRAGFGGALASLGAGILCMSLWGWRHGVRTTLWSTLLSSLAGFCAALGVHRQVGYTDFFHLLPVYLGIPIVGSALLLSRRWLLAPE